MLSNNNLQVVVSLSDLKELWHSWLDEYQNQQDTTPSKTVDDGELMTPTQFAHKNHVSKTTIWRWVKSGVLKQTIIGSKVYYRQSDLKLREG